MAEDRAEKPRFENVDLLQSLIGGRVPRPTTTSEVTSTKTDIRRTLPSAAASENATTPSRSSQEMATASETTTTTEAEQKTTPRRSWQGQGLKTEPSLLSLFSPRSPQYNTNASADASLSLPDLSTGAKVLSSHQSCISHSDRASIRSGDDFQDGISQKEQDQEHSVPRAEPAQLAGKEPFNDASKNGSRENSMAQKQTGLQALFDCTPSHLTHRTSAGDPRHILGVNAVCHKEKWSGNSSLRSIWSSPDFTGHQQYELKPGSPSSPASAQSQPIDGRRVPLPTAVRRSSENLRPQRAPATPQELSILFAHTAVLKPRLHREIHELDASSGSPSDRIHELEVPPIPKKTNKGGLLESVPPPKEDRENKGSEANTDDDSVPQPTHGGDGAVQEWLRTSRILQAGQSV